MEKEFLEKFCDSFPFVDELSGKTILVTGGTGLIGSYILKCVIALSDRYRIPVTIYATARTLEKTKDKNFAQNINWLIRDLKCNDKFPDNIDIIFHTACPTQSLYLKNYPVEVINDSIIGARELLEYCKSNPFCRLIYISSIEIYGQKADDLFLTAENEYGYLDHLNTRSCYPESKKLIETMCTSYAKEYGVNAIIARLTQTIGAEVSPTDNRVFVQFAKCVSEGKNIVLHTAGSSSKSYVHAIDVVSALFYLVFKGIPGEAYNVANKDTYISVYNLANFVVENFNSTIKVVVDKKDGCGYAPDSKINLSTAKLESMGWKADIGLYTMFSELIKGLKEQQRNNKNELI